MPKRRKKPVEVELEFLPSGGIRFTRQSKEHNEALLSILRLIFDDDQFAEAKAFLEENEETTLIFGDRIYCG
jgi:hypothetical protein